MKHIPVALAIAAALALGACTMTPGGTPPSGLQAITVSDLQSTALLAKANNDTNAYQCDEGLIAVVQAFTPILPSPLIVQPVLPPGSVKGLAYDFEEAHLAALAALNVASTVQQGVLTPAQKQALETACGPFIAELQIDQITAVADLGKLFVKVP
jgi:hypothetical protein